MTNAALEALQKIHNLNKYPCPQTPHAIQKILKALHVADYMAVVEVLEARALPDANTESVPRG